MNKLVRNFDYTGNLELNPYLLLVNFLFTPFWMKSKEALTAIKVFCHAFPISPYLANEEFKISQF